VGAGAAEARAEGAAAVAARGVLLLLVPLPPLLLLIGMLLLISPQLAPLLLALLAEGPACGASSRSTAGAWYDPPSSGSSNVPAPLLAALAAARVPREYLLQSSEGSAFALGASNTDSSSPPRRAQYIGSIASYALFRTLTASFALRFAATPKALPLVLALLMFRCELEITLSPRRFDVFFAAPPSPFFAPPSPRRAAAALPAFDALKPRRAPPSPFPFVRPIRPTPFADLRTFSGSSKELGPRMLYILYSTIRPPGAPPTARARKTAF
jgi:hypothetical protein